MVTFALMGGTSMLIVTRRQRRAQRLQGGHPIPAG
jgi:hypothetical protein